MSDNRDPQMNPATQEGEGRVTTIFLVQPFFEEGGGWDDWGLYPGTEEKIEAVSREAAIAAYLALHGPLYSVLDWKVKDERLPCCLDCGYVGNRTFARDDEGGWRDVLGGERGITPYQTVCSNCGSRRYRLTLISPTHDPADGDR